MVSSTEFDDRKMLTPQFLLPSGVFPHFFQDGMSSVFFSHVVADSAFHVYFPDQGTRARLLSHSDCLQGTPHAMGFFSVFPNAGYILQSLLDPRDVLRPTVH